MAFMTSEPREFPPELSSQMYRDANFRVEMNGRELPFRFEGLEKGRWAEIEMSPPDSLPVWEVTIPRGETVSLHMTYDVLWSGGADGSHLHREFSYRARPAALWAGVVEEAEVSFLFDELTARLLRCLPGSDGGCFRWKIEPEGYEWVPGGVRWHMAQWEPSRDFGISFDWYE
jgi:hypothetical protein